MSGKENDVDNDTDSEEAGESIASKDSPKTSRSKPEVEGVTLRPYPKIVFMYPTLAIALVAAICLSVVDQPRAELATQAAVENDSAQPPAATIKQELAVFVSLVFLWIFAINLLVLAFDFPGWHFLTLAISLLAVILGFMLLSHWKPGLMGWATNWLSSLQPMANATFYWIIVGMGLIIGCIVCVVTRLECWEVRSNEILHRQGLLLKNVKRYPAPNVQIGYEKNDTFEFLLLGSGRVILTLSGEQPIVVLDNILWIDSKETAINDEVLKAIDVN
ncbi:MAG: hypothetical protein VB855_14530 [Pirellulaceae bacterium]